MQNSESKQKGNVVPVYASLQWDFYHSSAVSSFVNQQNQQQQQPPPTQPTHTLCIVCRVMSVAQVLKKNCSFLNLPKVHKSQQYKLSYFHKS